MRQCRTRIVCTIGPASCSDDVLAGMVQAGMDVARLNCSHGTRDDLRAMFASVRRVAAERQRHVGIMMDLQGPKIRTGALACGTVELVPGAPLTITTDDVLGDATRVSTTYEHLPQDVKPGDRILLADGAMELRVAGVAGSEVQTEVVEGGVLGEHKGINLPGVELSAPSLTEKDREDLALAAELGADWVALSFVRSANDLKVMREAMAQCHCEARVVAKLEKPEAIADLERILELTDAVMVARGDLGVELPPELVPILQKRIVSAANRRAVPVITATQMLESMIDNPRPTRAEASDVANAVFDGTDAVMLSAETAMGKYPVPAVQMMDRIAYEAELVILDERAFIDRLTTAPDRELNALTHAACQVAAETRAAGIIALTRSGFTARLLAAYRPTAPIVAVTPSEATARRLSLIWGIHPLLVSEFQSMEQVLAAVDRAARDVADIPPGGTAVVVSGRSVLDDSTTHILRLHTIKA